MNTKTRTRIKSSLSPFILVIFLLLSSATLNAEYYYITSNSSDSEERISDGDISLYSSDLEMSYDTWNTPDRGLQIIGLRFNAVSIPVGAIITSAKIHFKADVDDSNAVTFMISGELSDDSSSFTDTDYDLSSRTNTSATVSWSPSPWINNNDYETVDISPIIQEIVNQPTYAGDDIAIFIRPDTGCTGTSCRRRADSRDTSIADAPKLEIEYILLNEPISEYRFDECKWDGTPNEVVDTTGNIDGTIAGDSLIDISGQINHSGTFDGNGDYINLGDSFNTLLGSTNNTFSITSWIYPTTLTSADTNHRTQNTFIAKASDSKNDNLEIGVNTDGTLHLYLDTTGPDGDDEFGNAGDIQTNQWNFIGLSYDGSTTTVNINGNTYTSSKWQNTIKSASGSPFTIGASLHVDNFFTGKIDEVKIFDTVLSSTQLNTIYSFESNGKNYDNTTRNPIDCNIPPPPPGDEDIPNEDSNATETICGTFEDMFQTHGACSGTSGGTINFNNGGSTLDGSTNIILENNDNSLNTCQVTTPTWVSNQFETCGAQGDCIETGVNGGTLSINYNNPPTTATVNANPSSSTNDLTLSTDSTLSGYEYDNVTTGGGNTNIHTTFDITNQLKINTLKMTTDNIFDFQSLNPYSLEIGTLGIENNGASNTLQTHINAKNIKIHTFNLASSTTLSLKAFQTIKMDSFTVGRGSNITLKAQYVNINSFTSSNSGSGDSTINIYADYIDIGTLDLEQTVTLNIYPYTIGKRILFRTNTLTESSSSTFIMSSGNYYINTNLAIPGTSDISAMRALDENQLINLYINNNLTLGNNPGINATGNNGNYSVDFPAANFMMFINGDLTTGGGGTTLNATIYLDGDATFGNPTYIKGAINANTSIEVGQGQFTYDQSIDDAGWSECTVSNLIGQYRFDSCSLTSLVDSSGNNNNGTIQNFSSEYLFSDQKDKGMLCRAGRFYSFKENYATAGTNLKSNDNTLSIAFALEWSGKAGKLPIIVKDEDYNIYLDNGKLYYRFGSIASIQEVQNVTLLPKQATHIAFVVNKTTVKTYQNGVLKNTSDSNYTTETNDNVTYIGGDNNGNYFGGLLDEINFYDGTIDTNKILELSSKRLRPCNCCPSKVKMVGDYIQISNTYDSSQPLFDAKNYLGSFEFDEPPLLFMLPSNDGTHSAYLRARNVTTTGFEVANIEPQGEDGPHIAMNLNYIAINEGVHTLGDYTLESCTIPIQTEQVHDRGALGNDVNKSNRPPDDFNQNISCDANGCWTKIAPVGTYTNPVVFATLATDNNERRTGALELSYPWMTVAIKNDATGIWISLERSETTKGGITKPEEVAYIITEGNIQSSFLDDYDNNISYETIHLENRFLGFDHQRNDLVDGKQQRFDFNNTYANTPLVMANKNSRKDPDGGWFRRNALTKTYMEASIWEDRDGADNNEDLYDDPTNPETPIGKSANQDTERDRDIPDDGALIAFDNVFKYAETYKPTAGAFDAVENGASYNTILETKIVSKPFSLRFWSLDTDEVGDVNGTKVIYSPVKVDLIYSQDTTINLGRDECNASATTIPNSTKYVNFMNGSAFIDNNDYNISTGAYRNVNVRFTYASDENNETANWLSCYSNSANCNSDVYTSSCVATCQTNGADSEDCVECYFDHELSSNIKYTCSYDRFAIRPDKFDIAINGSMADNQNITAGTTFQLDINASDAQLTPVATQEYNATQKSYIGVNLSQFTVGTKVINTIGGCVDGEIKDIEDNNFTNGVFNTNSGYFTEIGDINISVEENSTKEFAKVDRGNLDPSLDSNDSVRYINPDIIQVHFNPHHFDVNISLSNFNDNNYTYYETNASKMGANINYTIQAMNLNNSPTTNFKSSCYAEDLNHTITFDFNATSNMNMTFVDKNDTSEAIQMGPSFLSSSTQTTHQFLESNTSFDGLLPGGAIEWYKINFTRSNILTLNPSSIQINSFDVWDKNRTNDYNQTNTFTAKNHAIFYYGRVHAPDQRFGDNHGTAPVYYEVYCDDCNKTNFNIDGNESIDSINWFTNTLHVNSDGNVSSYTSNDGVTFNGTSNEFLNNTANISNGIERINLATSSVPHKDKISMISNSWLEFSPTDFMVEFYGTADWAGQGIKGKTVDLNISRKQNKRLDW